MKQKTQGNGFASNSTNVARTANALAQPRERLARGAAKRHVGTGEVAYQKVAEREHARTGHLSSRRQLCERVQCAQRRGEGVAVRACSLACLQ